MTEPDKKTIAQWEEDLKDMLSLFTRKYPPGEFVVSECCGCGDIGVRFKTENHCYRGCLNKVIQENKERGENRRNPHAPQALFKPLFTFDAEGRCVPVEGDKNVQ